MQKLFLFGLLLATLASSSLVSMKRTDGPVVDFSQFPSTALVIGSSSTPSSSVTTSCTGSILSGLNFVLTTATCVSQNLQYFVMIPNPSGSVTLGGTNYDQFTVSSISANPAASTSSRSTTLTFTQGGQPIQVLATLNPNDVAVLRLSSPISTSGAQAVSLSTGEPSPNTNVRILGFGLPPLFSLSATDDTQIVQPTSSDQSTTGILFAQGTQGVEPGDQGGPWELGSGNQIALSIGTLVVSVVPNQTLPKISTGISMASQITFINSVILAPPTTPPTSAPVSPPTTTQPPTVTPPPTPVVVIITPPPTTVPTPEPVVVITPPPTQPPTPPTVIITPPPPPTRPPTPPTVIITPPTPSLAPGARIQTPSVLVVVNGASSFACATILAAMICLVHLM